MNVSQRRVLAIALAARRGHLNPEEAASAVQTLAASHATVAQVYHGGQAPTLIGTGTNFAPVGSIVRGPLDDLPEVVSARMGAKDRADFEEEFRELEADPPRARLLVERVAPGGVLWKDVWHREDTKQPSTQVSAPRVDTPKSEPPAPSIHAPVGRRTDPPPPISLKTERLTRVEDASSSRYDMKRELARGGMGRVLIAVDRQLGREVAIKEMLVPVTREQHASGSLAGGDLERFLREARVTGQLEHPNIVPVYEIGERPDGTVFYSMKLVRGESMADRLKEIQRNRDLSPGEKLAERLKMLDAFGDACQAVAYAHARGVINRDLKPSNIMCGDFGETLVLDWGLARVKGQEDKARKDLIQATAMMTKSPVSRPDSTKLTLDGSVVGTPSYMPPEQARGELDEIDERSDVYSLGAVLYELATGMAPFEGPSAELVLRSVLHTDPLPPRKAEPHCPKELEAIILQALAKEKARRISSAKVLASEVAAFRDGRTISLYQYTLWEQIARFVKRYRTVSMMVVLLVLAMVAGTVTSLSYARVAKIESESARLAEADARAAEREAKVAKDKAVAAARRAEGQRLAAISKGALDEAPSLALLLAIEAAERAPGDAANNALYTALFALAEKRRFTDHELGVGAVGFSPDGRRLATGSDDYVLRIYEIDTGKEVRRFDGILGGVHYIAWSEDGRRVTCMNRGGLGRVFDVERGIELAALNGHGEGVRGLAARPGGGHFATWGADGTARLWAASTGDAVVLAHGAPVLSAAFAPDGALLATSDEGGGVRLWECGTGKERHRLAGHTGFVHTARFSPDGKRVVTAGADGTARIWDVATGECLRTVAVTSVGGESGARVFDAAWRADGQALGLCLGNGTAEVWSADGAARSGSLASCTGFGAGQMLPDWSLASRAIGFTVSLQDPATGKESVRLRGHEYSVGAMQFSRDGRSFATGGSDRWAIVWGTRTGAGFERSEFLSSRPFSSLSGDLRTAAVAQEDGTAAIVDVGTGRVLRNCGTTGPPLRICQLSADGSRLLTATGLSNAVELFDATTGSLLKTLRGDEAPVDFARFCGAGPVWVHYADQTGIVFDGVTGERMHKSGQGARKIGSEFVSPDGRWLAWHEGGNQKIRLFDLTTDHDARHLAGHTGHTLSVDWCPDSKHFVTSAADASIRKWSVDADKPVGYYRWPSIQETRPMVTPDGKYIYVLHSGRLRMIDAEKMTDAALLESPLGIDWVVFSEDGSTIAVREREKGVFFVPVDALGAARRAAPRALTPAEVNRFDVLPAEEREAYRNRWFELHPSAYLHTMRGKEAALNRDFAASLAHFERGEKILPNHWLIPYYRAAARVLQREARPPRDPAREDDLREILKDVAALMRFGIDAKELGSLEELRPLREVPEFQELLKSAPQDPPR